MNFSLKDKSVGFIGMGNMGQAILRGLVTSETVDPTKIFVHNRSQGKVQKVVGLYGCQSTSTAEDLVDKSDIVILATKPQDLLELLEPLRNAFNEDKVVISLAAGIQLRTLKKYIPKANLVRVMPNTPIFICKAVIGFCMSHSDLIVENLVKKLFSPLGHVVSLEEGDPFSAFTVASASGTGFVFELMHYWQDWILEHGISEEEAKRITIETFLGTALLAASEEGLSIEQLTEKVASKKGVTAAGLQSMRELELEGILRMSFNKAVMRDHELGKNQ
ncbi:MAG: pyrroline-5-carboxylate reductase [Bdellovibrionales bacterium]|nr:pyrroline-5-carboxylate reductase [Bdellovibrionales bacterium]